MNEIDRIKKLGVVEHYLEKGTTEYVAAFCAGVSVAWYRRTQARLKQGGIDGLRDKPRSGRPRKQS